MSFSYNKLENWSKFSRGIEMQVFQLKVHKSMIVMIRFFILAIISSPSLFHEQVIHMQIV